MWLVSGSGVWGLGFLFRFIVLGLWVLGGCFFVCCFVWVCFCVPHFAGFAG